jgi:hypothetical protein
LIGHYAYVAGSGAHRSGQRGAVVGRAVAVGAVTGLVFVLPACGSAANHAAESTSTSTTVAHAAADSVLSFREVRGEMPYGVSTAASVAAGGPDGASSCHGGRLVTPPAKQTSDAQIVLTDRQKSACYELGPTLLLGTNVGSADAVADPTSSSWIVNVHFTNDDFVKKVASVELNKQIAIVLDGVVQSAPKVDPGITGSDVTISGGYDQATARGTAARIDPSSRSRTPETPTTTATDALMQTFSKRCEDVGPRLGFSMSVSGVTMPTVATVRSGLERAHEPVPSGLANLDGKQRIALCYFTAADPSQDRSPTTICPNGDVAEVGAAPQVMFVVEANLTATKFPGMQYLLPTGMTVPPTPGPCVGLGSP